MRRAMKLWLAGLVLAWMGACGPVWAAGVVEASNWIAVCDNLRTCRVFALAQTSGAPASMTTYLTFDRQPGAAPRLALKGPPVAPGRRRTWRIRIDGCRVRDVADAPAGFVLNWGPDEDPGPSFLMRQFDDREGAALLAAIRTGRRLTIGAPGQADVTIDLAGAAQAFTFVDAEQTAPRPEAPILALAPALPQPRRSGGLPDNVLSELAASGCPRGGLPFGPQRVGTDLAVWGATCGDATPGAPFRLFIGDLEGRGLQALRLPAPPVEDSATFQASVNGVSDDKRTLDSFPWKTFCGREVQWIWTGSAFAVARETEVLDCRGVLEIDRTPIYVTRLAARH